MDRTAHEEPVAVVGLGVAGAAVAAFLARMGCRVTVFERSGSCEPQGGGIVLQPSGVAVLRQLQVLDEVVAQAAPIRRMEATRALGAPLVCLDYDEVAPGCQALGVLRGILVGALQAEAVRAGVEIQTSQPVDGVEQAREQVFLTVGGVRRGPFAFVVAADGVHSRLRSCCNLPARVMSTGRGSLWVTLAGGPNDGVQRHYVSGGRLLGLLPVASGQTTLFWGLHRDDRAAWRERGLDHWKSEIHAIAPGTERLLATLHTLDEVRFAEHHRVRLGCWSDRRVVFLGDSAHAVGPHLGQGVNLALLDVAQLAGSLATCPNVCRSFADFARRRRRQVRFYSELARLLSRVLEAPRPGVAWARDRAFAGLLAHPWSRRQMVRGMAGLKSGWLTD